MLLPALVAGCVGNGSTPSTPSFRFSSSTTLPQRQTEAAVAMRATEAVVRSSFCSSFICVGIFYTVELLRSSTVWVMKCERKNGRGISLFVLALRWRLCCCSVYTLCRAPHAYSRRLILPFSPLSRIERVGLGQFHVVTQLYWINPGGRATETAAGVFRPPLVYRIRLSCLAVPPLMSAKLLLLRISPFLAVTPT